MASNTVLVHRPYAIGLAKDWIANRNTWHLDVYLYVEPNSGALYVHALTLEGGQRVIGQQYFALIEGEQLSPVQADTLPHLNELTFSVATLRAYPWLADCHRTQLAAMADLWPRGLFRRRSIQYHYLKPHMVNEPTDGLLNYYSMTGREVRDREHKARMTAG